MIGILMAIATILDFLEATTQSVSVTVQTHGDLDLCEEPVLLVDGGMIEEAKRGVEMIEYGGGGDAKEHHLDAIERLAIQFRGLTILAKLEVP